jgi:tetratricopeptide (TPR) repeat protein
MNWRVASLAGCILLGCGSQAKPSEDPVAIGRRLAEDKKDWHAHRDLARLRLQEGYPGEALREFLLLERLGKLSSADKADLGLLLVNRAGDRVGLGDPGALEDLDHAGKLGQGASALPDGLLNRAMALSAVAALRHSSTFSQEKADMYLARLAKIDGDAVQPKHMHLDERSEDELLLLLDWFTEAGARRHALRVAEAYVQREGRKPEVLLVWLQLHSWWYGERRPPLPSDAAGLGPEIASPMERFAVQLHHEESERARGGAAALIRDWTLPRWAAELAVIEEAYRVDPALSDRKARRFVDRVAYGASRRALVAELFYRLQDSSRSKTWALELAELSAELPSAQLAAGLACAVDGEVDRAHQFFTRAAAASGDPGRYWALAARMLRLSGQPLAALGAGKRALSHTAPGRDMMVLLELSRAQSALGRDADAGRTLEALLQRVPESRRVDVLMLVDAAGTGEPKADAERAPFLESLRSELGL